MTDGPRPLNLRELAGTVRAPAKPSGPRRVDAPLLAPAVLEDLARWLASAQERDVPAPLRRPRLVVLAGDHGVAAAGVSRLAPGDTARAVRDLLAGRGPTAALAAEVGVGVAVHALGVDWDAGDAPAADADAQDGEAGRVPGVPEPVTRHAVRAGSGDVRREDAMTAEQTEAALRTGAGIADTEVDEGADLLVLGDLGVGATTVAAALVAACLRKNAVDVVGRGSGVDDDAWMRKTAAVRDATRRARKLATRPVALLQAVGSPDVAAAVGFLLRASARRTPVLLDGAVSLAAALVASRGVPGAEGWWRVGARTAEPAQALAAERLKLTPLLDLGAGRGGGTGALAAVPLLRAAQVLAAADAAAAPPALAAAAGPDGGTGAAEPQPEEPQPEEPQPEEPQPEEPAPGAGTAPAP
ncbi:nicotinate-nucleotide--dimethylbenzimidazole phosphoribosyltransferase [Kineococcus sp. SYSU DK004]|uniref:nicotinate-nucleotide--dimethylbenzimidazole phosphoribosyltransferase n=1 Tax=Kineococcus sp. SYSU DK004 TaxID=3383125 RepID=UPI003D7E810A